MNRTEQDQAIRRILVALDSSPASLAVLQQAVALAATLKAELLGLFVEDINLVRLAELSFTHEVGLFSATSRRLEIRYVERQLRAQANRARQALATLGGRAGLHWSFRVARGVIATELLTAASEADLVILGKVGASSRGRGIGSTTRAVLVQATQLTLIVHPGVRLQLPYLVLYDGSPVAQKALIAAAQLAPIQNNQLVVLILADTPEASQQLQQEADSNLAAQGITGRYLWWRSMDGLAVLHLIRAEGCGMLVLPSDGTALNQETIFALLAQVDCPVLLVR
jgi:nucleotide-binding universal stress UspA family protein